MFAHHERRDRLNLAHHPGNAMKGWLDAMGLLATFWLDELALSLVPGRFARISQEIYAWLFKRMARADFSD